ncbi:MAG: tRNA (guanosine(46)-N7)-methyltransferase TrmB, partial [Parasynechococcus sp.]
MRQHVNPLSRFFQLPLQLPSPAELFVHPDQPIHLDIGCARGRCILGLAELNPAWNHLGVEIRRPLVTSADRDAVASGNGNVRVLFCNANISLESWLAALPDD